MLISMMAWEGILTLLGSLLPLVTAAGRNFEYEYASVAAWAYLLTIPLYGAFRPLPSPELQSDRRHLYFLILGTPLLSLLPALVTFAFGMCPCEGQEFRFWWLVQTLPTLLLAWGIALIFLRMRLNNTFWNHRRMGLLVFTFYLFTLMDVVGSLWFHPQKRLTHFAAGFFHGPIYDDWIPLDWGILITRLAHYVLAATLLSAGWGIVTRKRLAIVTTPLALVFLVLAALGLRFPSVGNGKEKLDTLLPDTVTGEGFTLHSRGEKPEIIERLVSDTRFHISELRGLLGQPAKHVDIYVYPDRNRMKLWFGGDQTDVTDVVTPSVHITADEYPHRTLRHELVHALASRFGFYGLGFHPNMAFTEGLATALAPPESKLSLDAAAAALIKSGRLPDIHKLFSPLFWEVSGARAYTVAGSMVGYLIRHHGIAKVRDLYSGKSWRVVFGDEEDRIIQAWQESIAPLAQPETELQIETLFRHPGVLNDLCPHTKATRRKRGKDDVLVRLRQPFGWDVDTDYLPWRLALDPTDAVARTLLWEKKARLALEGRNAEPAKGLLEDLTKDLHWPPRHLEDVELEVLASDLERLSGDRSASLARLEKLTTHQKEKGFGAALIRQITARLLLEESLSHDDSLRWRWYLAGLDAELPDQSYRGQDPWIVTYLKVRRGPKEFMTTERLNTLLKTPLPDGIASDFALEWYKSIALHLDRLKSYTDASLAYLMAKDQAGEGLKAVYDEHSRRMLFKAALERAKG